MFNLSNKLLSILLYITEALDIPLTLIYPNAEFAVLEKNPYPPYGRSLEIPKRGGVLNVKLLEANYEAKLEFPGGRGAQN